MLSGASIIIGIVRIFWHRCIVALLRCRIITLSRRFVVSSYRRRHRWSSQALLPPSHLPPSSRQPLLLPPLQLSVDGWLLCHLCHCLPPDLSSTAFVIVRSSTLLPPAAGRRHRSPTFTSRPVLSITFAAPVDGWLLRSPPAQQHTNQTTKLKTFSCSHIWTYFELLAV